MNKCDYEPETCENEPRKNITGTENKQIPMPLFRVQNNLQIIMIPRKLRFSENSDSPKILILRKSNASKLSTVIEVFEIIEIWSGISIRFNQSECQFFTTWYFLTCSLRSTSVVNKSEKYRNVPSTFPCLTLQWPFLLTKRVCRLRSDTSWFGKSLETRGLSSVPFVMLYQDFYRVPKHLWPWPPQPEKRQNFGVKSNFSNFNPKKHFRAQNVRLWG